MKRTLVILSLLVATVSCRNKHGQQKEPSEPETKKTEVAAAKTDDAAAQEKKKVQKPQRPEPKTIPAPEDVAAPPKDAGKSATGLAWKVLQPGTGKEKPKATDKVEVHYTGWTKDGKMFDSSVARGEPTSFPLNGVIKGWTEGLQLMTVGEKRRFWIPGDLAYGETPRRPGAPAGQLTFDVELLGIVQPPKPPETPGDVAAPPASATKTASGLAYTVLKEGAGATPGPTSRVMVHYSGWTKDGKMFDSSVARGQPIPLSVNGVIKGWTEALQLMKEGAKYRLWIPADLAYGEKPMRPGAPSGQLTFDVELLKVM
jgi:peptidylprolyl isomerase